jgi:2-polyprenyl-6-methoxyphenol hydroxylase-like FAD-dependent oxidoreductase
MFLAAEEFWKESRMTKRAFDVDVVVAGAGPVGLMLAMELRIGGVSVAVLERRTEIDMTIKAGSLNVPTVEALYRRGLRPALEEAGAATRAAIAAAIAAHAGSPAAGSARPAPRFIGHFGGIVLDPEKLDSADPELAVRADLAALGLVPQQHLEAMLEAVARELGADIRRGVTFAGFSDDGDQVVVETDQGPIRTGWLVGCDGGRSQVRKLAGFDFPGTEPEITAYQAMAQMDGTAAIRPGWTVSETGVYVFGPAPSRVLVAEFGGPPVDRDAPVTPVELEGAIRRVTGVDVTVRAIQSVTRFTDNARQATTYRRGRVLLAGDAAHVHSPFGGQGLNLGIGDAVNLGWKLAATVRGWAPDGLLDTYTAERHPIGAWVLDWTRAQIAIMRPDPHARAARKVFEDMAKTVDGTTYLAKRLAGVWQGYDLPGDHPLVGRSAPDLELADSIRLADHLHEGRALLLDLGDDPTVRDAAAGYENRLKVVTAKAIGTDLRTLFVRPDGAVAYASETASVDIDKYLTLWLGEPAQ